MIKPAYKSMHMQYHPDKVTQRLTLKQFSEEYLKVLLQISNENAKLLNSAYEVIGDMEKRRVYDLRRG